MVGPKPGKNPRTGMMWILLGSPAAALPIPLWVISGRVPKPLDGEITAPICDEAQKIAAYLYSEPEFSKAINTFRLARWLEHIDPVETRVFALVADKEKEWGEADPDSQMAAAPTDTICSLVLATYSKFRRKLSTYLKPDISVLPTIQKRGAFRFPIPGSFQVYDVTGRKVTKLPPSAGVLIILSTDTLPSLKVLIVPD